MVTHYRCLARENWKDKFTFGLNQRVGVQKFEEKYPVTKLPMSMILKNTVFNIKN
jgi:hypothetical protein